MNQTDRRSQVTRLHFVLAAAGLLATAACATTPPAPPTEALRAAQSAIASAEQARAAEYAPAELSQARQDLASARAAVEQQHMITAERLAQEARAGADLASARTEVAKATAVNNEMRKGTEAMKQEMQRHPGAK